MAQQINPLVIIAEPKELFRERYYCEVDRSRNKSQRFIRARPNLDNHTYPTIQIPKEWDSDKLYIRVTLTTVQNESAPFICIHPYPIGTSEPNVIKDPDTNTLFFPISVDELNRGVKSFKITLTRITLQELRNYGPLTILNSNQKDIQHFNSPPDAKRMIELYQLSQSRLLFSIADRMSPEILPVIYERTSVFSQVMTSIQTVSVNEDDLIVRCVPRRGRWRGGDEIVMIIPKIDKRKAFRVHFLNPSTNESELVATKFVDSKTITFRSPPCPIPANSNQTMNFLIVVNQGDEEIARTNFCYESFDKCFNCNTTFLFDSFDESRVDDQLPQASAFFDPMDDQMDFFGRDNESEDSSP